LFETAYSVTEKPCDGVERPGGSWCALVGERNGSPAGLGLVNDAKHGYSASGSTIAITLLRSPSFATHDPHPFHPDEDLDFIDQGAQRFSYIITPLDGDGTSDLSRHAMLLSAPLIPHLESSHPPLEGAPGREYEGAHISPATVMMTVLKRDEEDTGWIVRLFETSGQRARGSAEIVALDIRWSFDLEPHEVATYLLRDGVALPTTLIEMEA
jgi:alpha-mannosidase